MIILIIVLELPEYSLMKKSKKVLICVAHSDDETIGCGGTIAAHIKNKDQVFCVYMTDGVGARSSKKKRS